MPSPIDTKNDYFRFVLAAPVGHLGRQGDVAPRGRCVLDVLIYSELQRKVRTERIGRGKVYD
jgi:hypothetical protein